MPVISATVLGVDPGAVAGGLAWLRVTASSERDALSLSDIAVEVADLPTMTIRRNRHDRKELDIVTLRQLVFDDPPTIIFLESVGPRPEQGSASTARFMENYGMLRGCFAALGIPTIRVVPAVWKRFADIPPGSEKEASRLAARKMFPALKDALARKKDHGRAEAVLIGYYGAAITCSKPASLKD